VGPWAVEKLECLRKYLNAYTTILSQQHFEGYFYLDAFAGPGNLRVRPNETQNREQLLLLDIAGQAKDDREGAEYIAGSPRVALELDTPFTDYIFVEMDQNRIQALKSLKNEFSEKKRTRIHIRECDCNAYLLRLLQKIERKWHRWRGVVFLDPFGMQVPWHTIKALGATGAIEVLINFPVGMAIQRLLRKDGQFTEAQRAKLNEYFGTDSWFELLYRVEGDLFGEHVEKVQNAGDVLVRWYRERLKTAFEYVTTAREVQNTRGRPLYYLIFAGPNETGANIANHVLRQGARQVR